MIGTSPRSRERRTRATPPRQPELDRHLAGNRLKAALRNACKRTVVLTAEQMDNVLEKAFEDSKTYGHWIKKVIERGNEDGLFTVESAEHISQRIRVVGFTDMPEPKPRQPAAKIDVRARTFN